MLITVLRKEIMKQFYCYINKMPQEIPTPPFIVDVNLFSADNKKITDRYNKAFKLAKYMTLSRERKLFSYNDNPIYDSNYNLDYTQVWEYQYKFRLFGIEQTIKEIKIIPKEWFYKEGVISTYFGRNPITLEMRERKFKDIINLN